LYRPRAARPGNRAQRLVITETFIQPNY